ncbi:MAG TPA: hypothetical protein VHJ37_05325 [Thermoleophilaceae bacterium]|jgi:hypothetical protein|nr:hypothetical protein [Thermoleophilaceae bacterium]
MRVAFAAVLAGLLVTILVVRALDDADPAADGGLRAGLLVKAPRRLTATCERAAARLPVAARCPLAIPVPDGAWGRARDLDSDHCKYLIDVEPGAPGRDRRAGAIYHLLFGARCRRFDLSTRAGRWPAGRFFGDDLRLVGRWSSRPVRPFVVRRLTVGTHPALLLRYPPQPLTTVHSGHLAIIWNEGSAGYAVSGHPVDPISGERRQRAVDALRAMALAM